MFGSKLHDCTYTCTCTFFSYRHLYYSHDLGSISRMNLDGTSEETVVIDSSFCFCGLSGLAVDHRLNVLYWALNNTQSNTLKYMNMTEWEEAIRYNSDVVS